MSSCKFHPSACASLEGDHLPTDVNSSRVYRDLEDENNDNPTPPEIHFKFQRFMGANEL